MQQRKRRNRKISSPEEASQERLGRVELLLRLRHQFQGLGLVVRHDGGLDEEDDGFLLLPSQDVPSPPQQLLPGGWFTLSILISHFTLSKNKQQEESPSKCQVWIIPWAFCCCLGPLGGSSWPFLGRAGPTSPEGRRSLSHLRMGGDRREPCGVTRQTAFGPSGSRQKHERGLHTLHYVIKSRLWVLTLCRYWWNVEQYFQLSSAICVRHLAYMKCQSSSQNETQHCLIEGSGRRIAESVFVRQPRQIRRSGFCCVLSS